MNKYNSFGCLGGELSPHLGSNIRTPVLLAQTAKTALHSRRNISMSENTILPHSTVIGSERGLKVVSTDLPDFDEIFSNQVS